MGNKIISPLTAEKKFSNYWLHMDFKPLVLAYIGVFAISLLILSFGFLKQANALPGWLSPLTDAFNGYFTSKIWALENVDIFGGAYSRAERELLKFIFGISVLMTALYNGSAAVHVLWYLPRLRRAFSGIGAEARKVIISFIGVGALTTGVIFDGLFFVSPSGRAGNFSSSLLPVLFYLLVSYFALFCASVGRRIVVSQVQLRPADSQSGK